MVVLVEVQSAHHHALQLLQDITAQKAKGAFSQPVLAFALSTTAANPSGSASAHDDLRRHCTLAGATDLVRSPLSNDEIDLIATNARKTAGPVARFLGSSMVPNLCHVMSMLDVDQMWTPDWKQTPFPSLVLPEDRMQDITQAISSWHFAAHDFTTDEVTRAAMLMLEHALQAPELESARIPRDAMTTFLVTTRRRYRRKREVHYHNWRHAVDVTQSLFCFLLALDVLPPLGSSHSHHSSGASALSRLLTPLDALILLVSAIGHDVGHPGVNNAFLVASSHPLSLLYNDRSVLENFHCAGYWQLLRRFWPQLGQIDGFRNAMLSTILATDMQRHFEYMTNLADLKQKFKKGDGNIDDWSDKDLQQSRELTMSLLMKAADISNVARPYDVSATWAKILMDEFSRQGELEAELQIPTCLFGGPPVRGDVLAAAQSQTGFINLFGFPLFQGIAEVLPGMQYTIDELNHNKTTWERKIEEEKAKRDIAEMKPPTFSSVQKSEVDEAKARHRSEPAVFPASSVQSPSSPRRSVTQLPGEPPPITEMAEESQHLSRGFSTPDKRSSAPFLGAAAMPFVQQGAASRRSSKDVALDQLHKDQLSQLVHQNLGPGSRRGSADANFHINQSFPGSRRGSKDESLTTILVTSQGSPSRKTSPPSPGKMSTPSKTGKSSPPKRHAPPHSQSQQARNSVPSSRSHATSSATATTAAHSPSTQPSSLADTDDELTPPAPHASIPSTEDPFLVPGSYPSNYDGTHHSSLSEALRTPTPSEPSQKSESPRIVGRVASGDSEDASGRRTPAKAERGIRESRSRSRLRGLKFWKKKKDVNVEGDGSSSP